MNVVTHPPHSKSHSTSSIRIQNLNNVPGVVFLVPSSANTFDRGFPVPKSNSKEKDGGGRISWLLQLMADDFVCGIDEWNWLWRVRDWAKSKRFGQPFGS
jgi:hypothetical protein